MDSSLKKAQIAFVCGQSVKAHIDMFNSKQFYDENMGWDSGVNEVNQSKDYIYSNAKQFELYLKRNVHNTGRPPSALSLYYLSQEPDFDSWYNVTTASKLGLYGPYGSKYGHVLNILELHKTWDSTNYIKAPSVEEQIQSMINNIVDKQLPIEHHTCAKLLVLLYQFRFRCASIQHNIWYEFKNHRWVKMENAYVLRNLITESLSPFFENKKKMLSAEKGMYYKINSVERIIKSLHNNAFKNGIIKEYATLAYDPNFLTKLDKESSEEVIEKSDEKIITNISINSNNEIESLVNNMRSNKISTIQIIDGKTIVTYDI